VLGTALGMHTKMTPGGAMDPPASSPILGWVYQREKGKILIHLSHSLATPFGRLCLLLLPLDTRFIIKSPFFNLREKSFFGQFLLEISYGFFNLIVLYNNFHILISLFNELLLQNDLPPPLPPLEAVSQSLFVIASDRRECGNLLVFNAL
jgi:hypothetical protein